jgi:riboflavin synthase alpha subunit
MFTGLVREICRISSGSMTRAGRRFTIRASRNFGEGVEKGDSIMVNGCCQTVEEIRSGAFTFTAVPETLKRTTLGSMRPGQDVNVEKAVTPEQGLGGHVVTGHVDAVGRIDRISRSGGGVEVEISCPREVLVLTAPKGSIAVDGMSLTVVSVKSGSFTVALIPYTLKSSIAKDYRRGSRVNLEADIMARYAKRLREADWGAVEGRSDRKEK